MEGDRKLISIWGSYSNLCPEFHYIQGNLYYNKALEEGVLRSSLSCNFTDIPWNPYCSIQCLVRGTHKSCWHISCLHLYDPSGMARALPHSSHSGGHACHSPAHVGGTGKSVRFSKSYLSRSGLAPWNHAGSGAQFSSAHATYQNLSWAPPFGTHRITPVTALAFSPSLSFNRKLGQAHRFFTSYLFFA